MLWSSILENPWRFTALFLVLVYILTIGVVVSAWPDAQTSSEPITSTATHRELPSSEYALPQVYLDELDAIQYEAWELSDTLEYGTIFQQQYALETMCALAPGWLEAYETISREVNLRVGYGVAGMKELSTEISGYISTTRGLLNKC